jgi:translation initiation factor IF-2
MVKIRAYKLAEELGIDRNEFVEKARAFGVELKNAMASLDEETADSLRGKFGGGPGQEVVERTVEGEGGRKVIRRRRRAAPAPAPAPELVAAAPEPGVEDLEAPAAEPEPIAAEADGAEEPEAESEPAAPEEAGAPGPGRDAPAGPAAPGAPREAPAPPGKGKQRKRVREVVNLREQEQIARQVSGRTIVRRAVSVDPRAMQSPRRKRRDALAKPQPAAVAAPKQEKRVVRIEGSVTVGELARQLGQKAPAVQGKLMALGTMASVNQAVDAETAATVAREFGFEVQDVGFREEEFLGISEDAVALEHLVPRPPVITVMGHVDHGKTSILDALRKTDVVAGEAGGITQHIGAYQVTVGGEKLTFIDTPGHAAFTTMRARGAQATDIVVLVVAATEGAMPQTVEAIAHAKAAGVPIVVAVNKCDLPGANPQQTRQRLMEHDLIPEEFGGDIICVETSATQGTGLDKLLEMLKLQAELLELKADPDVRARGVVLEAELDKGRGPVATVLVQQGTLRRGDVVVVGTETGRVRTMINDKGQALKEAGPSMPVQLVGLSGIPEAGQPFHGVENERVAKDVIGHRVSERRIGAAEPARPRRTLEELFAMVGEGTGPKELAVVIKADVHGSVEALGQTIEKLSTDEVKVKVIHSGVGAVSESDVMLARASDAIIVAFHVRPDPAARKAAESQGVDIRLYRVIYEATDEIRAAMAGLLPPRIEEKELGRAEVRETFTIPKIGTIAGSYVVEGLIRRNAQARLVRDGVQIYSGKVGSLRRFKDDAREVQTGFECGIGIDGYNDLKVGDVIEVFELQEKPATLE